MNAVSSGWLIEKTHNTFKKHFSGINSYKQMQWNSFVQVCVYIFLYIVVTLLKFTLYKYKMHKIQHFQHLHPINGNVYNFLEKAISEFNYILQNFKM